MDKLNTDLEINYNNEPVFYCKQCLSLSIRLVGNTEYCDKCGGTEILESHIQDWEKIYGLRYGGNYINK